VQDPECSYKANHLSFQKGVLAPSPISVITARERRHSTSLLTCSSKLAQGLLSSYFLSHGYLTLSAILRDFFSFFENPGELRLIILRRKKGLRALQHTAHATPHKPRITFAPKKR
jgi:hypothetical protein